jgi:hypothetical protein
MPRSKRAPAPRTPLVTKRERILAYVAEHPEATQSEIALACDCSHGYAGMLKQAYERGTITPSGTLARRENGRRAARRLRASGPTAAERMAAFQRRRRCARAGPMTPDEMRDAIAAYEGPVTRLPPGTHMGWRPRWV